MLNHEKELNELKASIETIQKQYQSIRADYGEKEHDEKLCQIMDAMYSMVDFLHQRIDYLREDFYEYTAVHGKGHLPSIPGSDKMKKVLKKLDLDEDYSVYTPMIFASQKGCDVIEISYSKTKE